MDDRNRIKNFSIWMMAIMIIVMIATFTCPAPSKIMDSDTIDLKKSSPEIIISHFKALGANGDSAKVNAFWNRLKNEGRIPYTKDSVCLFMYNGEANSVSWNGAFNQWGRQNQVFRNNGTRISGTDIWYLKNEFPSTARLEYKIVIDEPSMIDRWLGIERKNQWIHDPANPNQRKGGFGPDSEIRMPNYVSPKEILAKESVALGTTTEVELIHSDTLGYDVSWFAYLPANFKDKKSYPVVFVTDGHEYSDPDLGAMNIVLDNQIAAGILPELIAIYIDPRDPETNENRRMNELSLNESYVAFLADELFPTISKKFNLSKNPRDRVILGTSLGGLNAAHVAISRPDVFGSAVIHSPAFWYRPAIFDLWKSEKKDLNIFMSSGTIHDTEVHARQMRDLMKENGYEIHFVEMAESHSWGMWCGLIDDGLAWVLKGEKL